MNVSNDPSMTSPSSTEPASGACDGDDTVSTDKLMEITRMMRPCVCVVFFLSGTVVMVLVGATMLVSLRWEG